MTGFLVIGFAAAQPAVASEYRRVSELYRACLSVKKRFVEKEVLSSEESSEALLCLHYLEGFEAGYLANQEIRTSALPKVCMPGPLSGAERALIFVDNVKLLSEDNPEILANPVMAFLPAILAATFPCK
ncbi:MAG: hypothetical protein IPO55_03040 [Alphaproteobacteria bacterium]|nr:hypothetical protein [Alphaproteobacteria bacterium]